MREFVSDHRILVDERHVAPIGVGVIVLASPFGSRYKHYYVVTYVSFEDDNTGFGKSVYGLMLTTNIEKYLDGPYNYGVGVYLNNKPAMVQCDKLVRIDIQSVILCSPSTESFMGDVRGKYGLFLEELGGQMMVV